MNQNLMFSLHLEKSADMISLLARLVSGGRGYDKLASRIKRADTYIGIWTEYDVDGLFE